MGDKNGMLFRYIYFGFLLMITGFALMTVVSSMTQTHTYWGKASPAPSVQIVGGVKRLWVRSNIFSNFKEKDNFLTALDGKVFFIGSLSAEEKEKFLALDAATGEYLWDLSVLEPDPSFSIDAFTVDSASLYIGGVSGTIKSYDISNRELRWAKKIQRIQSPCCFYVESGILYTYWYPPHFFLLSTENGEIVSEYRKGNPGYRLEDGIFYYRATETVFMASRGMDELWQVDIDWGVYNVPVFTDERIFLRSGRLYGPVYAIDRTSGKVIFESNSHFISNIMALPNGIYGLSVTGQLISLNMETGKESVLIQFEPINIPYSENLERGYELAYDASRKILFVLHGDSAQLYAFQIL